MLLFVLFYFLPLFYEEVDLTEEKKAILVK